MPSSPACTIYIYMYVCMYTYIYIIYSLFQNSAYTPIASLCVGGLPCARTSRPLGGCACRRARRVRHTYIYIYIYIYLRMHIHKYIHIYIVCFKVPHTPPLLLSYLARVRVGLWVDARAVEPGRLHHLSHGGRRREVQEACRVVPDAGTKQRA